MSDKVVKAPEGLFVTIIGDGRKSDPLATASGRVIKFIRSFNQGTVNFLVRVICPEVNEIELSQERLRLLFKVDEWYSDDDPNIDRLVVLRDEFLAEDTLSEVVKTYPDAVSGGKLYDIRRLVSQEVLSGLSKAEISPIISSLG